MAPGAFSVEIISFTVYLALNFVFPNKTLILADKMRNSKFQTSNPKLKTMQFGIWNLEFRSLEIYSLNVNHARHLLNRINNFVEVFFIENLDRNFD
jgi:hypothetical protein